MVNLEGHGREEVVPNVDITRTIGWFTTTFPLTLALSGSEKIEDDLKAIKEQVRQIPNKGMEYGLLRYLYPDQTLSARLAEGKNAGISFNYLGQFNEQSDKNAFFNIIEGATASAFSLKNKRAHILDIVASIQNRQLKMNIHFSRELHHEQTISAFGKKMMDCLRALITHCQSPTTQGYTPSDFDKLTLNQHELDDILADLEDIF